MTSRALRLTPAGPARSSIAIRAAFLPWSKSISTVALLLVASTVARAEDWPQFLGPHRDGVSKETGLLAKLPADGPKIVWQVDVGTGYSGCVVAQGKVVLHHRVGDDELVQALNADTGKPLWKHAYSATFEDDFGKGNGPRSTPTIAGKHVVTFGAAGVLSVLDFETGKPLWTKDLIKLYSPPRSFFGVGSSPVVDEGRILVNVGAKNGGIVAFDLKTGEELWKATSDGASYSSPFVRELAGKRRAVFFTRNGPVIIDPKTGAVEYRQTWRARYDASVNAATPLVIGETLFFSASYETGALALQVSADKISEQWQAEDLMSNHYNTCVVHDGLLFGFDGRQEAGASLRCVDWKTRKVLWDRPRFGCGSMILADGRLYMLMEKGDLVVVEASKTFRELARAPLLAAGPCRAQICLANGRLYARDQRRVVCVDLKDARR